MEMLRAPPWHDEKSVLPVVECCVRRHGTTKNQCFP